MLSTTNVSGIITRDAPVSYWPVFPLFLVTLLEVFAKVSSTQFPFRFKVANGKQTTN